MKELLPEGLVEALSDPRAHPDDPDAARGVELVQTHISSVFLTATRVYKLRKAVDLGFVCFATREERNADCVREVLLNRRLAPDVYLGVAPIEPVAGGFRVGSVQACSTDAPLRADREHCVVMRRLPAGRDALALLERGALSAAQLERVAKRVARFHAQHGLGTPAPFSREAWRARILAPVEANFESLASGDAAVPPPLVAETRAAAAAAFDRASAHFERRRLAGRAVDGHGDIHLQHVFFEQDDADPLLIDCIEFNDELRGIDAASEVAFLAMDLRYRERPDLAEGFLRAYARESGDFDLYHLVDFFVSYRAAVRAKVAAIAAGEAEIAASQRERAAESAHRHLLLAREALRPKPPGPLVLVCGVVGTGKSTAAAQIADALGGAVVSSDRVRKQLAGFEPTAHPSGAEQRTLYSDEMTRRVYETLLEHAAPVVASGRAAVLDATWSRRQHRAAALQRAAEHGLVALLVEVGCAREVALARLSARAASGADVSDAGPERYDASVASFEPPEEWPAPMRLEVDTAPQGWQETLRTRVRSALSEAQRRA